MKKLLQFIAFIFFSLAIKAQQNYFVYLQTDNKQPFYVKVNGKVLSSSASGYVVIPKLTTGSYPLVVGFAKDKWPQQNFNLEIGTTDAGYLLKNFAEKGWGLYNIQTMEVAMNGEKTVVTPKNIDEDDAFVKTLSGATNAKIETVSKKIPEKVIVKEPVIENPQTKAITENINSSKIEKISNKKNSDGRSIVYLVKNSSNIIDTVDVLLNYAEEMKMIKQDNEAILNENPVKEEASKETIITTKNENAVKEKKFLDINMANEAEKTVSEKKAIAEAPFVLKDKPVVSINSDCKEEATTDDVVKTRKKMAQANNEEEMVQIAKKIFRQKCYSVEQIKNLSILLESDKGKYSFFDAVYPRVSDSQNYASLQNQLKDTYYINRFKAMLKN